MFDLKRYSRGHPTAAARQVSHWSGQNRNAPRRIQPAGEDSWEGQIRPSCEAAVKELRLYDPSYYCEVTLRTIGGAFSFDPNDINLRDQIYGVFAEAVERYSVSVFAFHFMSNHYHGLYAFKSAEQFVMFLAFLHGNLARLAHRINRTCGPFWAPLRVFAVAKDPESVSRRVSYILRQAVAAGLVDHPGQFPGASTVDAMLYGKRLLGRRLDWTQRCRDAARLVSGAKPDEAYETWVELPVAVPQCWADLTAAELRQLYAGLAADPCCDGPCGDDDSVPLENQPSCSVDVSEPAQVQVATPEAVPALPSSQPLKQRTPSRQSEDGGAYRQGPVKQKQLDGKHRRSQPPRLLAADQRLVDAYEERYKESVTEYRAAKQSWRAASVVRAGRLGGVSIVLPAWMLLGALPLRLGGDCAGNGTTVELTQR